MNRALQIAALIVSLSLTAFASHTVRDELGEDVVVPDHAHRIVCLAPNVTDMVFALGRGGDVVGITDYTKYPPEALQKPSVGGVIDPSLEKIVSLHPDLVLAIGDLNPADLVRSIQHLGLPIFVVHPHGLHDIYRSIENIGKAIDARQEAAELVARLQAREAAVRQRVAGKSRPTVFFLLWADPIMTAGRGAFITELIETAGGRSVTADLPAEWPRLSLESVLAGQPEYLLLIRGSDVTLENLQRHGNWTRLDAVRNGKVFYADERIQLASPVVFDALEDLATQFHSVNGRKEDYVPSR
ncbi:MAG TPA: cobalamin-binding protein [Candidatus Angelobacter sp.]|nr:cobalamin-binding protein [Candidatus Angelobacter sp.]